MSSHRRTFLATVGVAMAGLAGCTETEDDLDDSDGPGDLDDDDDTEPDDPDDLDDSDDPDDLDDDDGTEPDDPDDVEGVVGTLVEGDNLHLVIEDVEITTQIGEFQEADQGNEFVLIQLAMKNVTDEFVHVSQLLQASVRDDEDYSYSMAIAATEDPTFNDGQFAPGELERGVIAFELPEDATGRRLQFDLDGSIFGGIDRVEIDLEDETDVHRLEQELAIDTFGSGDAVEFDGVEVELRGMEAETELGMFAEADEGHEYVILDIEVTNNTGEEQRVSTVLQMMLKDGNGWTYQEDWMATAELDRPFDETSPLTDGETRAGEVVYEIEEGLSPLYWVFEYTLWTDGDKTFWQLR